MSTQYKVLVGDTATPQARVPKTGDETYLAPVTLSDATGNEVAFDIQYTTNKATSGDDTGLVVNLTDTASPGTSLLADLQTGGASQFSVDRVGTADVVTLRWGGTNNNRIHESGNNLRIGSSAGVTFQNDLTNTASSGVYVPVEIAPFYNQSGTAGGTDLLVNRTETAVGSGTQLLQDWQVGGVSKASLDTSGHLIFIVPTSDPGVTGALWNNAGTLSISA